MNYTPSNSIDSKPLLERSLLEVTDCGRFKLKSTSTHSPAKAAETIIGVSKYANVSRVTDDRWTTR